MPERAPPAGEATTADAILGGRLRLTQPRLGYRIAIDPVLLAAAVPTVAGERVLDAGCGVGTAGLALAVRVEDVAVDGLERQTMLCELARGNAAANALAGRFAAHDGDILSPPAALTLGTYDHVMANPPFMRAGESTPPPDPLAAVATVEGRAKLDDWVAFGARMLRPGGSLSVIHRADRLQEVLAAYGDAGFGDTVTFPLWPRAGADIANAKRMIVQGRLGSRRPPRLAAGLVLHGQGGGFTDDAEAVLRHAGALPLGDGGDDTASSRT